MTRTHFISHLLPLPASTRHRIVRAMDKSQISRGATTQPLRVGFYGCMDQLVRVGWRQPKPRAKAPQSAMVDCPACGNTHSAGNFMFRAAHSQEEYELTPVKVFTEEQDDSA